MIACAQAIHALGDNLAHVVYFGLGFNLLGKPPLDETEVSLFNVRTKALTDRKYQGIREQLDHLSQDTGYKDVAELVNHAKHCALTDTVLALEPEGTDKRYEMRFAAFRRNGVLHETKEVESKLGPGLEAASRAVVLVGNALIGALEARDETNP